MRKLYIIVLFFISLFFLSCSYIINQNEVNNAKFQINGDEINLRWEILDINSLSSIKIDVFEEDKSNKITSFQNSIEKNDLTITELDFNSKYIVIIHTIDIYNHISKGVELIIEKEMQNEFPVSDLSAYIQDKCIFLTWKNQESDILSRIYLEIRNELSNKVIDTIYLDTSINTYKWYNGINSNLYTFFISTVNYENSMSISKSVSRLFMDFSLFPNIPILSINTTNEENPTCDFVSKEGTWGESIINNEYITGEMKISLDSDVFYESGYYKEDKSGVKIKIRGNTSAYSTRKSYKIKLEKKSDLLSITNNRQNMDYEDKEWILLNGTRLKTIIGLNLSRFMGIEWEPEYTFCMFFLNGDFKGLYLLTESIKKGVKRININDSGFIIENDPYYWKELKSFHTKYQHSCLSYTFKYPDEKKINENYFNDIVDYMNNLDNKIFVNIPVGDILDFSSSSIWLLTHDLLGTGDYAGSNMFLTKYDLYSKSKLKMGPLWDFDSIYATNNSWCNCHVLNMYYPVHLVLDEKFCNIYIDMWNSKKDDIPSFIETFCSEVLSKSNELNICRELTYSLYGTKEYRKVEDDIEEFKDWMKKRIIWINEHIYELNIYK